MGRVVMEGREASKWLSELLIIASKPQRDGHPIYAASCSSAVIENNSGTVSQATYYSSSPSAPPSFIYFPSSVLTNLLSARYASGSLGFTTELPVVIECKIH